MSIEYSPDSTGIVVYKGGTTAKGPGWCEQNNAAHAWEAGPTLTSNPPIHTRHCLNCGKTQWLRAPNWEDRP